MNSEERLHREQLDAAIKALNEDDRDWPDKTAAWLAESLAAFEDMRERDGFPLSDKQHAWVEKVAETLEVDLPRPPPVPVPKGKPVGLLVDQMPKPLKPPPSRRPG